jgi:uncharacterized membrane protein YtjA (UPF0391 family)
VTPALGGDGYEQILAHRHVPVLASPLHHAREARRRLSARTERSNPGRVGPKSNDRHGGVEITSVNNLQRDRSMLRWAIIFFIVALVAAVLGFGGISGMSFEIAKFIAIIAVILFVVSLVVGGMRGRGPRI